jgi:hypothetical protein
LRINDMRRALDRYAGHRDVAALDDLIRDAQPGVTER